jgi:hypothetical protein
MVGCAPEHHARLRELHLTHGAAVVTDPMFRHAGLDLFVDRAVHGRGIGRETAVRVVD